MTTPLLLPVRVMACALDPAALPDTLDVTDKPAPHKWSWSPPDYGGFTAGGATPLSAVWPTLFNVPPGAAATSNDLNVPPSLAARAPGVCVSWSLPAGWSRPLDPKDPRSLPSLPDRWLVVRFSRRGDAAPSTPPRVRTWVVDAGVLVDERSTDAHDLRSARVLVEGEVAAGPRRVGAVRTAEAACAASPKERRVRLHAQGSEAAPDFTFSAFVPANLNNLSFIDPLDDLLNAQKDAASDLYRSRLTYLVLGWYRDPLADDPLRKFQGAEAEKNALRALGVDPVQRLIEKSPEGLTEAAARAALGLPEKGPVAPGDASIFHGVVANVDYFDGGGYFGPVFGAPNAKLANGADGFVDPTQPAVGFGETAEEALSRLASKVNRDEDASKQLATQSARLIDALLTDQWRYWDALGGEEAEPRAKRASTFRTSPGGSEWEVVPNEKKDDKKGEDKRAPGAVLADVKADAPALAPEQRRALFALNEAQQALDAAEGEAASAAETLYTAWWALQADPSPADAPARAQLADFVRRYQKRVGERRDAETAQRKAVTDAAAALLAQVEASTGARLTLKSVVGQRYFMPKEPAVALRDVGARAPGAVLETPWRKAPGARIRREGDAAEPEVGWIDAVARSTDDAAFQDALREVAREGVAVERLVAEAVTHHTDATSTRKNYDVWRRRALGVSRDLPGAAMDPPPSKDKTLPRSESFAARLVDQDAKEVALRELGTVWTHQPWMPLFLDWEVEWFLEGDGVARSAVLRGRTVLAHRPQNVIRSRYEALIKRPDLGVRLKTALSDCALAIREVLGADIVAQSLGGLHQRLTLRDDALPRVLPAKGDPAFPKLDVLLDRTTDAPASTGGTEFSAFRNGSLVIRRLWVVDRFGQAFALNAPPLSVPASALHTPGTWRVKLQPRSLEPMRLVVRPRMPAGATSVVRAWVLPNLLDASLTVYDADAAPLGVIAASDRVRWFPAQPAAPAAPGAIADPCLRAFVERLVHEPGEAASPKSARFEALKATLDDALSRTFPAGTDSAATVASLLGRPLALVRARVGVERRGGGIADPNWLRSESWQKKTAAEFEEAVGETLRAQPARPLTITVGSRYLVDDGVVGYYAVGGDRAEDGAELVQTAKTLGARAPKLTLPLPRAESASWRMLDLLLDPRGRVHLEGDIVPGATFALSPTWYDDALKRLPAVMRLSSVLLGAAATIDPDAKPGERARAQLPLPAATQASAGAEAPRSEATLTSGGFEIVVEPAAPVAAVEPGEAVAVDGVLLVGGARKPSTERPADERLPRPPAATAARAQVERRVIASGEVIELPVSLKGAAFKFKAQTDWLEYNGRAELFLCVTLSSEGAPAPAASSVNLVLPAEWKPGDVFVGSGPDCVGLADNTQRPWKVDTTVISDWEVALTRLHLAQPAAKDPAAATGGAWYLMACVLLRQSKKSAPVPLTFAINGSPAANIDVVVAAPKAIPYTVKLLSDTADTSALKYGSSFKLSWEVARVISADLWGPLTDDGSNHITVFPTAGAAADDAVVAGSKQVVVMGPVNFTLRAKVKVGGRVEEVVRSVTAGVLSDPRGGRLDVWPRQVLPRGPIAARWSAYKVTEFKFHSITGDVLDDETDGPAIGNDLYEYRPSDPGWATTVQGVPFTIDYGPRPGQDWTVEAECEPEGDVRALQCHVSAIGTRKLASSLTDGDSSNAQWSYLAVGVLPPATGNPTKRPASAVPNPDPKSVVGMAVGRFAANEADGPDRWREWIAVATKERLDVHINKLFDQRSYRVNPALHEKIEWLEKTLKGGVLGVGAAEIAVPTAASKALDASADLAVKASAPRAFELRGENIVLVRQGDAADELQVIEFRFPLEASKRPVVVRFKHVGVAQILTQVECVRVVPLWPRVYVFGRGLCFSYDRTDPDPTKWKAEVEPRLTRVASAEWEIVGVPRPRPAGATSAPRGGYLFALAKSTGRLWRFELRDCEVISSRFIEMASANGQVALLHDLQTAQGNTSFKSAMVEGRILLGRDEQNNLDWRNPINDESVLLMIGGALVARSEVHDPLVQPVYARSEKSRERRGIQDRAYNPRLNLWVRCGHPFFHARTSEGALFDSTARSLYCRTRDGEISCISPIEPSHLGFLAVDLAPRTDGFADTAAMVFDTLLAGQSLEAGEFLESKNKQFRLTLTKEGRCVLHRTNDPSTALWALDSSGRKAARASLGFDADLALFDADEAPIGAASTHDKTLGTLLRETPEAKRRDFLDKRLVVTDEGALLCLAKLAAGGADEVIWCALVRSLGSSLSAGMTLSPWEYLESKNKAYRLLYERGNLKVRRASDGATLWQSATSGASWQVKLQDSGELAIHESPDKVSWRSTSWGGLKDESPAKRYASSALELNDDGSVFIKLGGEVVWRPLKTTFGEALPAGEWLSPGESLVSSDGRYQLRYQSDGNFVFYENNSVPLWASHTYGRALGRVTQRSDGNLVLADASGNVHWSTSAVGGQVGSHPNAMLFLYREGYFKVLGQGNAVLYSNRWVRIRNGDRYLWVADDKRACNEWIHLIQSPGSWWEFRGDVNDCTFYLLGTNLNLNYVNSSGRVKLYDAEDVKWRLTAERVDSVAYWSILSKLHNQYIWNANTAPYVTGAGAGDASRSAWVFEGGLLPEGFRRR